MHKMKFKKVVPRLDLRSACEARALPSELVAGFNWAAHASKVSVD